MIAARHLIRCAALWLLALGLPADAAAKWTQLQSDNFLFIGDASERQIRRVAERLEQFREALLRVLPRADAQSPVPTVVVVFATDRSMTPVKPLFGGRPVELGGYFQGGEDANYIAVNAEHLDLAIMTIFHEYAHFLINVSQGDVPVWVGEGLAELYEMTEQLDGGKSVIIGRAPAHHVELLRLNALMPIKELVAVDHSAPIYNEGLRRGLLYAQSWALVHYLTLGNAARAAQFRNYLSAMESGTPHEKAFTAAFHDAAGLDRELFEYVRRFTFPAVRIQFPEKSATSVPRGKALDDDEADAYLADMQVRVDRVDEARTRVAAIQKRDPNVGRAFMVLGLIDLREKHLSDAVAHLEKAAALAPDDFLVQSAYGRSLVSQMSAVRNEPGAAARLLPQARRALVRATTMNPRSARAAWMLGYVELVGGGDLAVAVDALARAVQLDPHREQSRVLLASALARQGEYEKATALLGPLMASGRTPEVRTEARRVLTELTKMRAARATGAAANPITPFVAAPLDTSIPKPPGVSTPPPIDAASPAETPREAEPASRFLLRDVQRGERRVLGTFDAVECVNGIIVLRVTSNGRTLALRAVRLADVDFISYRSSTPGEVTCGPQKYRALAYATYRPDASVDGIDGVAVAIELLPDDFVPPNPPH
jgi:cytochrome c-type biogenesis protein CcmH/NrfG